MKLQSEIYFIIYYNIMIKIFLHKYSIEVFTMRLLYEEDLYIRKVMCRTEIFRRSIHYVPLFVLDRVLGGDGFGTRSVSLPESSSDLL